MHEIIVRSGIVLMATLRHFLRVFCAQEWELWCWGLVSCISSSVRPRLAMGEPFSAPKHQTQWVLGSQPFPSDWGGGPWGCSAVTAIWERPVRESVRWSHALPPQQPASKGHLHSCVAVSRCVGNCIRLFFFFCQKKQGWMGSDSFVRKVWKLVTESTSGVVWGDEQGTGYKAVVISLLYVMPRVLVKLGLKICGKGCLSDTAG